MGKIAYKEGADFPTLPTKTQILTKIIESDFLEDEKNPWFGKETGKFDKNGDPIIDNKEFVNLVKVILESVEDDTKGSRIWFKATASINEKAKLRPLLEAAAFDHDPTKKELEAYDTDDLVGQYVYVTGSYDPKDEDKKFLRPSDFMRYAPQFKSDFNKPTSFEPQPENEEDADAEQRDGYSDEVKALKAKLAELQGVKVEPAKAETSARKVSTREKTVAKSTKKATAEVEDPESAF